ncbi:hypothetical protein U1Q18_037349 [Sarracenia purpurea var. burkii]
MVHSSLSSVVHLGFFLGSTVMQIFTASVPESLDGPLGVLEFQDQFDLYGMNVRLRGQKWSLTTMTVAIDGLVYISNKIFIMHIETMRQ